MSRGPTVEGVATVRKLLVDLMNNELESDGLQRDIARMQTRLIELQTAIATARRSVRAEMEWMDLTQSGNFGHEHRMSAFLTELVVQCIESKGPTND